VSDASHVQDVGEQKVDGVGDGAAVFELVEVEAVQAAELVSFLPRQPDGDHDLVVALATTVAALPGGVGRRGEHGED